jgi:hypothetical protein
LSTILLTVHLPDNKVALSGDGEAEQNQHFDIYFVLFEQKVIVADFAKR